MLIGCARTSTVEQLAAELRYVREGDTLVVTRLDRLARSTADLPGIVAPLEGRQVELRILDFGGDEVDTRSSTGRILLTMFAAVAEFERAIMLERRRAGVARARAEGKYKACRQGKRAVALHAEGLGATATMLLEDMQSTVRGVP